MKKLSYLLRIRGPIGFLIIGVYRMGNIIYYKMRIPFVRELLYIIYKILDLIVLRIIGKAEIPAMTKIGKNLKTIHSANGVIINQGTVIEDNVTIFHQVTIGVKYNGVGGAPVIKSGAVIGAGAKILGPITIGENAFIGANAVVTRDVPKNSVVAGIPARVIKITGE